MVRAKDSKKKLKNALERENAQLKWSRKCASFSISSVHFTFRHFCYVQLTISQDRQLIVKSQLTAGNCIVNTLSPSVHCLCQLRFLDSFDHFSWPIGQWGQWVVHLLEIWQALDNRSHLLEVDLGSFVPWLWIEHHLTYCSVNKLKTHKLHIWPIKDRRSLYVWSDMIQVIDYRRWPTIYYRCNLIMTDVRKR